MHAITYKPSLRRRATPFYCPARSKVVAILTFFTTSGVSTRGSQVDVRRRLMNGVITPVTISRSTNKWTFDWLVRPLFCDGPLLMSMLSDEYATNLGNTWQLSFLAHHTWPITMERFANAQSHIEENKNTVNKSVSENTEHYRNAINSRDKLDNHHQIWTNNWAQLISMTRITSVQIIAITISKLMGPCISSRCFLQNKNFIWNMRNENISIKVLPITRDHFLPSFWQYMISASENDMFFEATQESIHF